MSTYIDSVNFSAERMSSKSLRNGAILYIKPLQYAIKDILLLVFGRNRVLNFYAYAIKDILSNYQRFFPYIECLSAVLEISSGILFHILVLN